MFYLHLVALYFKFCDFEVTYNKSLDAIDALMDERKNEQIQLVALQKIIF